MNIIYIPTPYFWELDKKQLQYTDILTYVAVKSFRNNQDHSCFPSYETVAKSMNASRSFVIGSIKRLYEADYLGKHSKYRTSNRYYFKSFDFHFKIPPALLSVDLTIYEKAMLILLRQFAIGTPVDILNDTKKIAIKAGLTYKTVYTQLHSLIAKGYVIEKPNDCKNVTHYKLSELVDWFYETDMPSESFKIEDQLLIVT